MQNQSAFDRRRFIKLLTGVGAGTLLACSHGEFKEKTQAISDGESAGNIDQPLRLHSNESPYGPFPQAKSAIYKAAGMANRYTDGIRRKLVSKIAHYHGIKEEQVLLGCGSIELLIIATDAFSSRSALPVIAEPVYEAIDYYGSLRNIHPIKIPLTSAFTHDLDRMAEVAKRNKGMVYICNPANPTGTIVDKSDLRRFVYQLSPRRPLVIDEAYAEYADPVAFES